MYATRITVVMPLFGYLILFQDHITSALSLGFPNERPICVLSHCLSLVAMKRLYLIYFGLTFLGISSLVFSLACPKQIATTEDETAFIEREVRRFTPRHLREEWNYIKKECERQPDFLGRSREAMAQPIEVGGPDGLRAWQAISLEQIIEAASLRYQLSNNLRPFFRFIFFVFHRVGIIFLAIPSVYTFLLVVEIVMK